MRRPQSSTDETEPRFDRRQILLGVAGLGGLVVGWRFWPREQSASPVAAPGEQVLGGYVKLGSDGHVTIIAPQAELGQGNFTLIAQVVADEMGADWRTVSVEPAPANPFYANPGLSAAWRDAPWPAPVLQGTDESLYLTPLEPVLRQAGAAARILLCKAAGERWGASWKECNTENGFVLRGNQRLRFGELAEDAALQDLPAPVPLRTGRRPFLGERLPRLDIPAKLDGSVTFAADIRLPDMVFAAIRQGPSAGATLVEHDEAAAKKVAGFAGLVARDNWIAVAGNTQWAAERALSAAKPRFTTPLADVSDASISQALDAALKDGGDRIAKAGDADEKLAAGKPVEQIYTVGFAPHLPLEPMAATASLSGNSLQLWIAAQLPGAARVAAARGAGVSEDTVFVHVLQGGGSFGRNYEVVIAEQVATLAKEWSRPVQLQWSRGEDIAQDRFRPASKIRVAGLSGLGSRVEALRLSVATADALAETRDRTLSLVTLLDAQASAAGSTGSEPVAGAIPPYSISDWAVDHHGVDLRLPTGLYRGGSAGFTVFALESFIDEMAKAGGIDPFSIRMGMLANNPRLAMCLSQVTMQGGWNGGAQGSGQGLACYSTENGHIAVLAEAHIDDTQRVRVTKLVAVADVGRLINPDIALQQVEGGLLHGLSLAVQAPLRVNMGVIAPQTLTGFALPRLADMPDIRIDLLSSAQPSGPIGDIGVPPVAPAIANAIASASGSRFRVLPLGVS